MSNLLIPEVAVTDFIQEGELSTYLGLGRRFVEAAPEWAYEVFERPRPSFAPRHLASVYPVGYSDQGQERSTHGYHAPSGSILVRVRLLSQECRSQVVLHSSENYELVCDYGVQFRVKYPYRATQHAMQAVNLYTLLRNVIEGRLLQVASSLMWQQVTTEKLYFELDFMRADSKIVESLANAGLELVSTVYVRRSLGASLQKLVDELSEQAKTAYFNHVIAETEAVTKSRDQISKIVVDGATELIRGATRDGVSIEDLGKMGREAIRAQGQVLEEARSISPFIGKSPTPILPASPAQPGALEAGRSEPSPSRPTEAVTPTGQPDYVQSLSDEETDD